MHIVTQLNEWNTIRQKLLGKNTAVPADFTRWGVPRGENRDSPLLGCCAKALLLRSIETFKGFPRFRAGTPGKKIGFVPTMGHLHQGHLSLCERAQAENEISVVSIFVNPTQFNQTSDFDCYPRTVESDIAILTKQNVDYLLIPDAKELYADHYQVQIAETHLSLELEGKFRPGYFTGMLTVVLKLLHLVQATRAYFGEKDYQQLLLVKKMAAALFLPVEIIGCETIRAEDGLAFSSRNSRLTPKQRELAHHFPRLLRSSAHVETIIAELQSLGFKVEYVVEKWQRRLGAVWLGDVRLIDNVVRS